MTEAGERRRLVSAAVELFAEKGYDAVSMDAISQRAGVGRTTLFRLFGSKEGLIFPDHDLLLARAEEGLSAHSEDAERLTAVVNAAHGVFRHYLGEGELARARYRLTSTVPALRDREAASVNRYIRLFRKYLEAGVPHDRHAALRADLAATAVVTAHNHVLRRWLRGETTTPEPDLSDAMAATVALFGGSRANRTAVVVLGTEEPLDAVLPRLRQAMAGGE